MATSNSFPVTPGVAGAEPEVAGIQTTEGLQQVVRDPYATAVADAVSWTASVTAAHPTGFNVASLDRVGLLIVNNATVRIYGNFSVTSPTSSAHHFYLDPGQIMEVGMPWCTRPVKFVSAASPSGTVLISEATDS